MGKILGGSTESKVKIPQWLEDAAKSNLAQAQNVASIGYTPYYGPEVAAFNPMQESAFQNTANASQAFGLSAPTNAMAGMPQAENFGGVMGYSSMPLFNDSMARFEADRPAQKALIDSFFIDPQTGQGGSNRNITGSLGASGDSVFNDPKPFGGMSNQVSTNPVSTNPAIVNSPVMNQGPADRSLFQGSTGDQLQTTVGDLAGMGGLSVREPVSVDSISDMGYTTTQGDPSFGDRLLSGAERFGRGIVDNTIFGRGYDFLYDGSLSDRMFGEQDQLSGNNFYMPNNLNLGLTSGLNMDALQPLDLDGTGISQASMDAYAMQQEVDRAKELERQQLISQGMSGGMLGQNPAGMSPIRSLFDAYDTVKPTMPNRTFRSMR